MPILSYFAVVGSALVALLFVADVTLEKRTTPLIVTSEFVGLPKAYQHVNVGSRLVTAPAPAPDMESAAVKAAMPAPQVVQAPQVAKAAPPIAEVPKPVGAAPAAETVAAANIEHPRERKKPARKLVREADRQNYAWSPNGDARPFSGSSFFGRF